MSRAIKVSKVGEMLGITLINVKNKGYSVQYSCPNDINDLKREGRKLTIGNKQCSFTLNGTQINTIKKVLEEAGEI